jgi:ABC-type nickel/cobalt efflux system permease component RcnA
MKIKSRTLQIITLSLAAVIILVSVLSATHVLNVDLKFLDEMTTYLLIIGVGLIVWGRKMKKEEDAEQAEKKAEDEKADDAVEAPPVDDTGSAEPRDEIDEKTDERRP